VAKWVHLTGGKAPRHDPAFIKEMIDMRMTGHEKPVPGTLGMDHERHAPPTPSEHSGAHNDGDSAGMKMSSRSSKQTKKVNK